jgi:hypothetical protein
MPSPFATPKHGAVARFSQLARRILPRDSFDDLPADSGDSDDMINTLLLVLGIIFFALVLVSSFFLLRRYRMQQRMRNEVLPTYSDSKFHTRENPKHLGLTIETKHNGRCSTIVIGRDGQPMLSNPGSPPHSPDNVPEIHITFPDEHDEAGRPKSGRVLVVRVGENATVGLEPMRNEQLPAYEKEAKGDFYSVDMDQIGGLKEKDRTLFQ